MLLFAPAKDRHAQAVTSALRVRGVATARIDLSSVTGPVSVDPGRHLTFGDTTVEPEVAVWWRRTGFIPDLAGLEPNENLLRQEESEALLLGGLLALTDHWVDQPYLVARAEHSLLQLAAARRLGLRIPRSLATNDPEKARETCSSSERWIAKATSAGTGIAPFADFIEPSMFELLPQCMTLLQEAQLATADVRVVVVGDRVMTWVRPRHPDAPLDWRAADPSGGQFVRRDVADLVRSAVDVNRSLGLRFSVQDWLLDENGPVFVEVNPSGQWLFLTGAETEVAGALAEELGGSVA